MTPHPYDIALALRGSAWKGDTRYTRRALHVRTHTKLREAEHMHLMLMHSV